MLRQLIYLIKNDLNDTPSKSDGVLTELNYISFSKLQRFRQFRQKKTHFFKTLFFMENHPEKVAGIYCYKNQPVNTKKATKEDFFHDGSIKYGLWYLIHSFHFNEFQAFKINKNFSIEKILPWLEQGRVYIADV